MNLQNGTYAARPLAASITESKNGHLMAVVKFRIDNGPDLTFYSVIVKNDGTVNTRNVEDLKKWSGWDGVDPYWLMDTDLTAIDVELVIANEPSITDPTKTWPAIKWVNPPGGGGGSALPEAADRRAVMAKYGAKLRALAGGTPLAAPVSPRPMAQAPTAPAAPYDPQAQMPPPGRAEDGPPPPAARPPVRKPPAAAAATQASAWALLNEKAGALPRDQVEALWFGFVDATGMDQADMTPEGWAQVQAAVELHFAAAEGMPCPF